MSSDSSSQKVTQRTIALFAGLLALLSTVAIVAAAFSFFSDDESDDVSWLYSQTSDTAELDDLGGGKYRLIMRGVDLHTIQFSDRPDRLVEVIDTEDFVHGWDTMFASSPPNAVLVEHEPSGETDSLVVVLTNPDFNYEDDEIAYDVEILADELHPERLLKLANAHAEPPVNMRAVSLFIDSVTTIGTNTGPIFTGPAADALRQKLGLSSIPTEPLSLGGGVTINSATVSYDSKGAISATAVVGFSQNSFTLNMNLAATDSKNWSLTVATGQSSNAWTMPGLPGLSINPATFSGSISSTNGTIAYSLTGSEHMWMFEDGASITSTPTFSNTCPSGNKCPDGVTGPFLVMNGKLTLPVIAGSKPTVSVTGGMTTNADWVRFDASASGAVAGPFAINNPTITIWHGSRTDSYDSNMNLPSLQKLTGGVDVELCGGFNVTIPKVVNKSTSGCARWSQDGVVIGQVGVDATMTGSLPSTGTSASASSTVKGLAWTNLSAANIGNLPSADVMMNGVSKAIENSKIVLAGKAKLPGVVTKALGLDLPEVEVDVTGSVGTTSFSLNGTIKANVNIGSEPFKVRMNSVTLSIEAESGNGAKFSIGTNGTATVGYSPQTRELATSVQLVAATAPESGMALSVTARGTAAPGETQDGLSAATALSKPSQAQYVWPNQFGIKGLNLWNLTVQISYAKGSPALGYTSTSYMDPKGDMTKNVIICADPKNCKDSDWMVGQLGFNISYTAPCFAYQFSSANGSSGFGIDGGVMKATTFKVGVAPTGCQIQSGNQQLALPAAFAGFQFDAAFGSTTVSVATKVSEDGFYFNTTIDSLKFAGISYKTIQFTTKITAQESSVFFTASMTSGMGNMSVTSNFAASSDRVTQSLDASMTDWGWKKSGTVNLTQFNFSTSSNFPLNSGCASFSTAANGSLEVGTRKYTLEGANFSFDCNGVQTLYLKVNYEHKLKWNNNSSVFSYLELSYPYNGQNVLYGDAGFKYERTFSKKYKGTRFKRGVDVGFDMQLTLDPGNPQNAGFSFRGDFDADRVSGAIGCTMDAGGGDFTCGGELRINPSWAGVYRESWGDL